MKKFRVKNFEKYQAQRRGKNVPWIKLMVNWREDYDVASLTDGQAMQYVGLLCLASKQGPLLPYDSTWIKRKIGCNAYIDLELFEKKGLIVEVVDQLGFASTPILAEGNGSEVIKQEGKGSDKKKKPKTSPPSKKLEIEILQELNQKAGKNFRPTDSNLKVIRTRLDEGFSEKDCLRVIENRVSHWKHDPKMNEYLRPITVFNRSKFEGYLNSDDFKNDTPKSSGNGFRSAEHEQYIKEIFDNAEEEE